MNATLDELFGKKRNREFIVEERDLVNVLKAINKHLNWLDGQIGNCGWADELSSKWFIAFRATDKQYGAVTNEMKQFGRFELDIRPGGKEDVCFISNEA